MLLVKCYDRKKVKSLVDLIINHVVWLRGGVPTTTTKNTFVMDNLSKGPLTANVNKGLAVLLEG